MSVLFGFQTGVIDSCEQIGDGFAAADNLHTAVFFQKQFLTAQLAVVVEAHGGAVSACIVDNHNVADVDFGELAVNGKFVVVFAERACNIVNMVFGQVVFALNCHVVVRAVQGGAH